MSAIVIRNGGILVKNGEIAVADDPCLCCYTCGTSADSGGSGVTVNVHEYPEKEGEVEFTYDAYYVPDAFKVEGGGTVFVDTGPVSGSKTIKFCKPQGLKEIKVTVTGPNGTGWTYSITCPDNPCGGGGSSVRVSAVSGHEPTPAELKQATDQMTREMLAAHPPKNPLP